MYANWDGIDPTLQLAYLGSMSHPCCMKAPIANQRLLKMVKLLEMEGPSLWSSMCHSNGLNRLTRNNTTLTPRYEKTMHIQISDDSGFMNENTPGSSLIGFCFVTMTQNDVFLERL